MCREGVTAQDDAFSRVQIGDDFRQILFIEEEHLHILLLHDFADASLSQCGDPIQAGRFEIFAYAGFGQESAIAYQYQPLQAELFLLNFAILSLHLRNAREKSGLSSQKTP